MLSRTIVAAVFLVTAGCAPHSETKVTEVSGPGSLVGSFAEIEVPAADGAGQPHVAASNEGFLVSWTEPLGDRQGLRFARFDGSGWSDARTIAERDDFFVNWADFPSIVESGSTLYAHWLQRSAPGTYNYDVMVSISKDDGVTWSDPFVVHDDGVKAEHGFVSMLPLPGGRVGIAWLDGRAMNEGHAEAHGDMSLRYAVLSPDSSITNETVLDDRTCECCTTAIASTPAGPLVAWRDRSDDEIRDISVARSLDGTWTEPSTLHADGWMIEGCPVNGPQADSMGNTVVISWFTAADDAARVYVTFSRDGGMQFDDPIELAGGDRVQGYVDVLLLSPERAFVVSLEDAGDRLELVGREVTVGGELAETVVIATTTPGRTGFPRMAKSGAGILLAWNEKGESPRIHVAHATISK